MTRDKLEQMLREGEGFTIEFKECVSSLNNSVFETVCSFSNRYGGYILLGVQEVEDADQDVSTSADLVANISNRKSSTYIERKIFPYADRADLCVDLIGKARLMAINRDKNHPWKDMDDMELLKSAGLYEKNRVTGEKGLNMACILLFGKPEVIQSCVPAKLIIEKDRIYTENWNRTQRIGKLELEDFTPYPKNPILAKFFMNIGYADGLGSGVRNLYKYTKIYSGGEPDLEEGDVFRLTVPLITDTTDNSMIGINNSAIESQNSAIEDDNSAIECQNQVIDAKASTIAHDSRILDLINSAIEKNNYSKSTKNKINQICRSIEKGQIFGTAEIARVVECSPSTAREILKKLRKMGVIKNVKGKGKGRYVFISAESASEVDEAE